MDCCTAKTQHKIKEESGRTCLIVGNPNVGKSVIFGHLAKKYVNVSNYPGTTVTLTKGRMLSPAQGALTLIDTPGINNFFPNSEDEAVTRDLLLESSLDDPVFEVLDAKNLKRGIFLALQLGEMGRRGQVILNMWDEAQLNGYDIDCKNLEEILGVPCIPTVAIHGKGIPEIKKQPPRPFQNRLRYHKAIESAIEELSRLFPSLGVTPRALSLLALSGDESFIEFLKGKISPETFKKIQTVRADTASRLNTDVRSVINSTRQAAAEKITQEALKRPKILKRAKLWASLERASTHPAGGFVLLGMVLYCIYQFVGVLGAGTLVDLTENRLFNGILNPRLIHFFDALLPFPHTHGMEEGVLLPDWISPAAAGGLSALQQVFRFIHDFFVGEYGLFTMALTYGFAIIFPVVVTFFMAFGLLEDVGYLPRLSMLLNRIFKTIGLNGKAVLPMILGLGCDTMATVTARILDTKKERVIVTFLLALAVPCSAQLGVIMFLLQRGIGFAGVAIWGVVISLIFYIAGFLASKLVSGEHNPLILEIPPLRMPLLRNILLKTLARVEWYLKEVIPIFVVGTALLFFMNEFRLLEIIQVWMNPLVVGWMQLPAEASEAILMGFFRRDYGAAGFIRMFEEGSLSKEQILVGVTTITLFVPCIANALVVIKERGWKRACQMFALILLIAFGVGGVLSRFLEWVPLLK